VTAPAKIRIDQINLSDPDVHARQEHHELLRVLRNEAPVHYFPGDNAFGPFWSITKYDDVLHISRNPLLFSSERGISIPPAVLENQPTYDMMGRMLIVMDPPRHVRLRRLVNKGFTPRAVGMLEPEIRQITRDLLAAIAPRGEADFVVDVAAQLPLAVICMMMGIPREDWPLMFNITNKVLGSNDPEYQENVPEEKRGTPDAARQTGMEGVGQMMAYFTDVVAKLRAGRRGDDITSILTDAEVDGEKLSDEEILFFCFLLVVAGNETTRNAISGGMQALDANPGEKAKLANDLGLLDTAVEEILRWASPVTHMVRTVTADTEIRGVKIPEGDRVTMWYPSVNRDEDVFADPYRFDITRAPNEHLAFGIGEHFCLGAGFARLELKIMFEELFTTLPDMHISGPVERLRSNFIGGTKHLPVSFHPR